MAETYDDRYNNSGSATRYIKQRVADISPTLDSDDDSSEKPKIPLKPEFLTSIIAGGLAGVVVDTSLYPLDTLKTRLQSRVGFRSSGGFSGVYKGIVPVLLCTAPISALFFTIYNTLVNVFRTENSNLYPLVYFTAASAAETMCASVRVPLEVIKQRKQTSNQSTFQIIRTAVQKEGPLGLYRGFSSTLLREIPFAAIQFPLWEYMIQELIIYQNGKELTALQTAYCGAAAGAIAAAVTTPLDVIKTRVMLAEKEKIERFKPFLNLNFARELYLERGVLGFFAGTVPRVLWITFGGFIYFGAYEKVKILCEEKWCAVKSGLERVQEISPTYVEQSLEKLSTWTGLFCQESKKESNKQAVLEEDLRNELLPQEQRILDVIKTEREKDLSPTTEK